MSLDLIAGNGKVAGSLIEVHPTQELLMKTARQEQNLLFASIRRYCDKNDIPHVLNAIETSTCLGFPDIFMMFYIDGITYNVFMEIKRYPDKFRLSQIEWWKKAIDCGVLGFIFSIDQYGNTRLIDIKHIDRYDNGLTIGKDQKHKVTSEYLLETIKKSYEDKHAIGKVYTCTNAPRYKAPDD